MGTHVPLFGGARCGSSVLRVLSPLRGSLSDTSSIQSTSASTAAAAIISDFCLPASLSPFQSYPTRFCYIVVMGASALAEPMSTAAGFYPSLVLSLLSLNERALRKNRTCATPGAMSYTPQLHFPHTGQLQSRNLVSVSTRRLAVTSNKKVQKKKEIILTESINGLGKTGDIVTVKMGYFRNYLYPQGMAQAVTDQLRQELVRKEEERLMAIKKEKDDAISMATAFATIGKFVLKKQAGQDKKIFGSVTKDEVAELIKVQMGEELDKRKIELPDIRETGIHEVTVSLHPEVTATVKIEIIGTK